MSDEDKKRFIEAVTGSGGKIDSKVSEYIVYTICTVCPTWTKRGSLML
jgi:hypothetical protein